MGLRGIRKHLRSRPTPCLCALASTGCAGSVCANSRSETPTTCRRGPPERRLHNVAGGHAACSAVCSAFHGAMYLNAAFNFLGVDDGNGGAEEQCGDEQTHWWNK